MRTRIGSRLCGSWIVAVAAVMHAGEAAAAWGDGTWGEMLWESSIGAPTAVPALELIPLISLALAVGLAGAWHLRKRRVGLGLTLLLVAIPLTVRAGTISTPRTFVNGTVADADHVNENFTAVETAVNDNDARITVTEDATATNASAISANTASIGTNATDIGSNATNISSNAATAATAQATADSAAASAAALQLQVNALQATVNGLVTDLAAANAAIATLQANSVLALDGKLLLTGNTARFNGVDVQVVNGTGSESSLNGLGNLIVGYNGFRTSGSASCSIGTYVDQTTCQANGGTWALNHKTGSHNLIVGSDHNYSSYHGLLAGFRNTVSAPRGSVTGGIDNTASGEFSSVSGGWVNFATGVFSSVSGGSSNTASASKASVSGGQNNRANAESASVSGGQNNVAGGAGWTSVTGGQFNNATGLHATAAGGFLQTADDPKETSVTGLTADSITITP